MSVEAVTYPNDLDPTAPTGASPKNEGDDHIRNLKAALKNAFRGFLGAVMVTGTDGGAANAYTLNAGALPSLGSRMLVVFSPVANNTGAATLNISSLGAKPLLSVGGLPLIAGDLTAGRLYSCFYDGTNFRLDNVTQNYVDQVVTSGTVPGVNDPANSGKVFGSLSGVGAWFSLDGRGEKALDKGNSGTTAQVVDYAAGEGQTLTMTGAHSLTVTGFPAGRVAGILLHLNNYGAYALTTSGITWVKADGSETTNFSTSGVTFKASGRDRVVLYSMGDGVIYGVKR